MANKTPNYQLDQWDPEDNFLRSDSNADNAKIEEALNQKCEVIFGSYTGDGSEAERTIPLGFTPRAVLVNMSRGANANILDNCVSLLAFSDSPAEQVWVVPGGFAVKNLFNKSNRYGPYYYIAFK